jgi:hypothetical protein
MGDAKREQAPALQRILALTSLECGGLPPLSVEWPGVARMETKFHGAALRISRDVI